MLDVQLEERLHVSPEGIPPWRREHHLGHSRTITQQKCEAVPRRARMQGSQSVVSLNSRFESKEEEEEEEGITCANVSRVRDRLRARERQTAMDK